MAKYDDIYPDAGEDFISNRHDSLPPVMKLNPPQEGEEHKCSCGENSNWVNPTATQYVCSTECNQKLWTSLLNIFVAQQIVGA